MIFVCVGSRNYQFDRLFIELDRLVEEGLVKDKIFAQIGTSTYKPKNFEYRDFLSEEEFNEKIAEADMVISHGATGSIMKALKLDKKVIAVTRLEKYGEHIDDHQIQTNEAFAENKYVLMVKEMQELYPALKAYEEGKADIVKWENKDPNSIINLIDGFIQKNI